MEKKNQKIGLIDVGGGMRDVFAAGVLDGLLEKSISFDYCIGVSAGSGNMTSFLAGQLGRNYRFYTDYSFRKEYIGLRNLIRNGNYVNLDYAYGTLTAHDGEDPLDYPALAANPAEFTVVACDARTGGTKYFTKADIHQDHYDVCKASSTLPVVNKPYMIDGIPYYDGGFADPVPVEKAFSDGCDKVVVILSRPRDYVRTPKRDSKYAKRIRKKYPKAAEALMLRYEKYNRAVARAKEYEAEGRVLIVAPEDCFGVDTLTRDKAKIERLFLEGKKQVDKIVAFI